MAARATAPDASRFDPVLDRAVEGRFAATSLALAVLGLVAELNDFALSQEEIARRVTAVGVLASDVLRFTAQLEAALDGKGA